MLAYIGAEPFMAVSQAAQSFAGKKPSFMLIRERHCVFPEGMKLSMVCLPF